jgi:integrase
MGRKRRSDTHLPKRMYQRRGKFYFDSPLTGKWEPLGDDIATAMAAYGRLIGPNTLSDSSTLGDLIDRYRTRVLPLKRSEKTRDDQGRQLERLKRWCGLMRPESLTVPMLYRYMEERVTADNKPCPVAARHEISLLGHVYGKAVEWGSATTNPIRAMSRIKRGQRSRYVTDAEFFAVRALANPTIQLAMDLARRTGQRRGDILSLKRTQFQDDGIVFQQSKTGAGVLVEWSPELREICDRSAAMAPQIPRDYVIRRPGDGKRYTPEGFSAMWQRVMDKYVEQGGTRFTFHDLRAKAASEKATIEEAAALLGHASTETTKRVYKRTLTRAKPV